MKKLSIIKKMTNTITAIGCCLLVIGMTGCADVLDTDSEMVEYEKDNTLNHPTDSVYSVLGIINRMQVIADRVVLLGELRSDLVATTSAANADLKSLADFDFLDADGSIRDNKYNRVSDYYAVINNCNYYLAHADTAMQRRGRHLFENEYAVVKAFRAWTYLELAKAYGNVPLVTEPLMTERAAEEAMQQPRKSIEEICQFFINDLTPYALVEQPDFGSIRTGEDSKEYFIPMRPLLGDLCLWAGRYEDAARWYNSFLNDRKNPVTLRTGNRITWNNPLEFTTPQVQNYFTTSSAEWISYIPMEKQVFDGYISDLENIFESTRENRYYNQVIPSKGMRRISADQTFVFEYSGDDGTSKDTVAAPRTGYTDDILVGDLRFYSNFSEHSTGGQDDYSEYASIYQTINKFWTERIITYRRTMVYLRYAEALNRAGYPQSAMLILKYGMCQDNIDLYVDAQEQEAAGDLIKFDPAVFIKTNTIGIHSYGSGDAQCNKEYDVPQPTEELASRADTLAYQIPLVEDMIITEMALEGAFEGYRFYDLMRVALRRNDPAYLANPISRRNGEVDENLRTLLMDKQNWYLPLR